MTFFFVFLDNAKGTTVKKENKFQEGKGEVNAGYLDIPEVRLSRELLKRLSVKRQKGIERTKNLVVVPSRQFKLSNFEVGCQNKKTVSSNIEQCTNEVLEGKTRNNVPLKRQHCK